VSFVSSSLLVYLSYCCIYIAFVYNCCLSSSKLLPAPFIFQVHTAKILIPSLTAAILVQYLEFVTYFPVLSRESGICVKFPIPNVSCLHYNARTSSIQMCGFSSSTCPEGPVRRLSYR